MDNNQIADSFSFLAKLTEIHGENPFKAKSYSIAAYNIEQLSVQLSSIPTEKIAGLKGFGESTSSKIIELMETGEMKILTELIQATPEGIIEMMNIKGLGPKKISVIWKEMEIENIGELLYACKENRLKMYKGFGEKTQFNVIETIEYYLKNRGSFLFSQVHHSIENIISFFRKIFPENKIEITGAFKRQLEIINELEIIINTSNENVVEKLSIISELNLIENKPDELLYQFSSGLKVKLLLCSDNQFMKKYFSSNCSEEFLQEFINKFPAIDYSLFNTENEIFENIGIGYIQPCRRESIGIIELAEKNQLPPLIELSDIKGIIHSHSTWSDGTFTLEEMVKAAIARGFEYLVISDHSKSAFYAKGLQENRIEEQHIQIDELNKKYAPFKVFKSIESDILYDGNLDYSDSVLESFDLVISSVHSILKMNEEKAMQRLLKAIENPFTTILGHLTSRLLLSRKGYPVDHYKIIEACAKNSVVIELNANPHRLDIDWRFINVALENGVLISINPDAHSIEGFDDIQFGVYAAQKTLLTKEKNLSSFSLEQFGKYVLDKKVKS